MATKTLMSDKDYLDKYGDDLPDSVSYAKWITSPDERSVYDGQTLATRNHEAIKKWAQARRAKPVTVPGTEHGGRPGVLRFDFPGGSGSDRLQEVDWESWFESFDQRELTMLFQEKTSDGNESNFFVLVNPHRQAG